MLQKVFVNSGDIDDFRARDWPGYVEKSFPRQINFLPERVPGAGFIQGRRVVYA